MLRPDADALSVAVHRNAVIHGTASVEPALEEVDATVLSEEDRELAAMLSPRLPYDETQAIFDPRGGSVRDAFCQHKTLRYHRRSFSEVLALRARGELPGFIASSAIPVDYTRRKLVFHRRGPNVKTYPHAIHTVGGAYVPGEDWSLFDTLAREALEEAGIEIRREPATPGDSPVDSLLFGEELSTGSVQIVYLHRPFQVKLGRGQTATARGEGAPLFLTFDELPRLLRERRWVPSGRLHTLVWLSQLATEPAFRDAGIHFAGKSAGEILESCVSLPWEPPSDAIVEER